MAKALRVFWSSMGTYYGELFPMAGMNLLWFVFSLPLFFIIMGLFALIGTVVPALGYLSNAALLGPLLFYFVLLLLLLAPNPASAGLHYYANQAARQQLLDFGYFWTGLRQYAARSALLFGIGIFGVLLMLFNLTFYVTSPNEYVKLLAIVFLYVLYFWLSMQVYILPLLIERKNKSALFILKNAALVALDNPGFTFVTFALICLWAVICLVLTPLVPLASMAVVATMQNKALLSRLEKYGLYTPEEQH